MSGATDYDESTWQKLEALKELSKQIKSKAGVVKSESKSSGVDELKRQLAALRKQKAEMEEQLFTGGSEEAV